MSDEPRNLGRLQITAELLAELIGFPAKHKIVNIVFNAETKIATVFVEGETLPLVNIGDVIPLVAAVPFDNINKLKIKFEV